MRNWGGTGLEAYAIMPIALIVGMSGALGDGTKPIDIACLMCVNATR